MKILPIFSYIEKSLVILLIVVTPLLFSGSFISVYEFPKLLFSVITISLLTITIFIYSSKRVHVGLLAFFFSAYTVSFINIYSSIMPARSMFGDTIISDSIIALSVYLVCVCYFCLSNIKSRSILVYIELSGFLVAITAFIHFIALYFGVTEISYDSRITGTIGQPNILGGILVAIIPVSYFLLKTGKTKKWHFFSLVTIVSGLILTMSRGALLAFFLFIMIEIWHSLSSKIFKLIFLLILILIPITLVLSPSIDTNKTKLPYLAERFLSFKDKSVLYDLRFEIWANSVDSIKEKPVTGWGNGSFQITYPMRITKANAPKSIFMEVESSHNFFVDLVSEWGIVGLLFFILLFISLALSKGNRYVKLALLLLLVRSLFNVTSVYIFLIASIYIGLLFRSYSKYQLSKFYTKIFIFIMLITVVISSLLVFRIGISEKYEKLALYEGDVEKVLAYYEKAIESNPFKLSLRNKYTSLLFWNKRKTFHYQNAQSIELFDDYKSNFLMGMYYLQKEDDQAFDYFKKAEKLNKRDPKVYHYLGMINYKKTDYDSSFSYFEKTIELDKKNFSDDYVYLGQIELLRGNFENAEVYAKLAAPSTNKWLLQEQINQSKSN